MADISKALRELSFFSSRGGGGGCGRNGMKDSVKFFIPPWKQQKNCWSPLSICENFMRLSPPLKPPPPKVCWVNNDVVPTCKDHCPCQLGVWGTVRSPGQSLRGVQGSEPTEALKIQAFLAVKMGYNGNCTQ